MRYTQEDKLSIRNSVLDYYRNKHVRGWWDIQPLFTPRDTLKLTLYITDLLSRGFKYKDENTLVRYDGEDYEKVIMCAEATGLSVKTKKYTKLVQPGGGVVEITSTSAPTTLIETST